MTPANPNPSEADPLHALRERIRTTQEAVERIAADTRAAAGAAGRSAEAETPGNGERRPPSRGYAAPGDAGAGGDPVEVQALVALIELARRIVPPEIAAQLGDLLRELLLLARAIIDWSIERLERRRTAPVEVEDIPIT